MYANRLPIYVLILLKLLLIFNGLLVAYVLLLLVTFNRSYSFSNSNSNSTIGSSLSNGAIGAGIAFVARIEEGRLAA